MQGCESDALDDRGPETRQDVSAGGDRKVSAARLALRQQQIYHSRLGQIDVSLGKQGLFPSLGQSRLLGAHGILYPPISPPVATLPSAQNPLLEAPCQKFSLQVEQHHRLSVWCKSPAQGTPVVDTQRTQISRDSDRHARS